MHWLPLALAVAVAFGLYNVCMKVAADHVHAIVGAVILQVVAALLGGGFLVWLRATGEPLAVTRTGVSWAVVAGLCVGLAEIGTFTVFARGAPVSHATPVYVGGSVLVAAVLGAAVLREALTLGQGLGVVLVIVGIGLVSAGS